MYIVARLFACPPFTCYFSAFKLRAEAKIVVLDHCARTFVAAPRALPADQERAHTVLVAEHE
jgi:hypothetical protein